MEATDEERDVNYISCFYREAIFKSNTNRRPVL